jgi:hypothetical protein
MTGLVDIRPPPPYSVHTLPQTVNFVVAQVLQFRSDLWLCVGGWGRVYIEEVVKEQAHPVFAVVLFRSNTLSPSPTDITVSVARYLCLLWLFLPSVSRVKLSCPSWQEKGVEGDFKPDDIKNCVLLPFYLFFSEEGKTRNWELASQDRKPRINVSFHFVSELKCNFILYSLEQ